MIMSLINEKLIGSLFYLNGDNYIKLDPKKMLETSVFIYLFFFKPLRIHETKYQNIKVYKGERHQLLQARPDKFALFLIRG